jgi:hypothetical protein
MTEAVSSSETSVSIYQTARYNIPEDKSSRNWLTDQTCGSIQQKLFSRKKKAMMS